ncbi:MAG: lecithin retinol acyltransferase family protein [Bacilli bacterium]|nr:lecithin retinol acyltransferase family protein [Bacilli bacterium]
MSFEINVKPIKGDLIRVKRKLGYYHYGIYIGHNKVIHYSAPEDDSIFDNRNIEIRKGELDKNFLRGDVLEVNIPYSSFYYRFVVCRRAKKLLGVHKFRDQDYDLLKNNCEHFANYCYFGEAVSAQSDYASQGLMGVFSSLGVKIFNNLGKRYRKKQELKNIDDIKLEEEKRKELKKKKGKVVDAQEPIVVTEVEVASEEPQENKKDKKKNKKEAEQVVADTPIEEVTETKKNKKKKKEVEVEETPVEAPIEQPVENKKKKKDKKTSSEPAPLETVEEAVEEKKSTKKKI